jgi:hypothetical protein
MSGQNYWGLNWKKYTFQNSKIYLSKPLNEEKVFIHIEKP